MSSASVVPQIDGELGARGHILLVVHGYPPQQATGAEVQARRKARWWHEHGYRVSVLAADPQSAAHYPFGQSDEHDAYLDGIWIRRLRFAVPDATRPLAETFAHPLLVAGLERMIAQAHPDLIYQVSGYLFGTLPLQCAARHGIPAALFAMDYWHGCQRVTFLRPDGRCCPGSRGPADCAACRIADRALPQRLGRVGNRALRGALAAIGERVPEGALGARLGVTDFAARATAIGNALHDVQLVIVNSHFLAAQFVRQGVPAARVLMVRQGIDGAEFAAATSVPTQASGALDLLYLGQIGPHKGTDIAVAAVGRLRAAGLPLRLRLHGPATASGTYLDRLRAQIAAINEGTEAIILGPPLERRALVAALRAAGVLVVPSRWYENSPNVILEAFAAGIPVVTAAHGGMAEMVRDGIDGLLFTPGDVASLCNVLRRLVDESDLLARLRAGIVQPGGLDAELWAEEGALRQLIRARVGTER